MLHCLGNVQHTQCSELYNRWLLRVRCSLSLLQNHCSDSCLIGTVRRMAGSAVQTAISTTVLAILMSTSKRAGVLARRGQPTHPACRHRLLPHRLHHQIPPNNQRRCPLKTHVFWRPFHRLSVVLSPPRWEVSTSRAVSRQDAASKSLIDNSVVLRTPLVNTHARSIPVIL